MSMAGFRLWVLMAGVLLASFYVWSHLQRRPPREGTAQVVEAGRAEAAAAGAMDAQARDSGATSGP
jgi:hypothetical protein